MNVSSSAASSVAAVVVEPMVAAPNDSVSITVTILDDTGALANGATISLTNLDDTSDTYDGETDENGVASFNIIPLADPGVINYEILDEEGAPIGLALARFYDASVHAPTITNAMTDHTLDKYDILAGVQLTIPAYTNETVGDWVTYYWGNIHHGSIQITKLSDLPVTFNVETAFPPACLANGDYSIFYQYIDSHGNTNISKPWEVTVTGGNLPATLEAPKLPEASNGFINKKMAADGTDAVIIYDTMAVGDEIELTWQVYEESGIIINTVKYPYTLTKGDIDNHQAVIHIEAADIPAVQNGSAGLWYTSKPVSGEMQSSVTLTIEVDTIA